MAESLASLKSTRTFDWVDLGIGGVLAALLYAFITVAAQWTGPLLPSAEVHLEARYLPHYALLSLARGLLAYAVSFLFTLVYGYVMARVDGAQRVMLPLLDILQSIPVLGFLPGFVLGLVRLFPDDNVGLEMASVLMIFTGQVWNMTFAFYASLKAVPQDLVAVAHLARMTWWERFFRLDLSFAAHALVWNSMMSMAGGWFFLMVSEAFVLGSRDFRLPGLGSYMSLAIQRGDGRAQLMGVATMLAMIVALDQVMWRPLVAWSRKFNDEDTRDGDGSWVLLVLARSRLWQLVVRLAERLSRRRPARITTSPRRAFPAFTSALRRMLLLMAAVASAWGTFMVLRLLWTLGVAQWAVLLWSAAATFTRVMTAVALATLWTVPVGVAIGRSPRWSRWCQPVIQMLASFPAPMIFPVVVGACLSAGVGLSQSSVLLLVLGTQWYILFNVIAGASGIPRALWEMSRLARFPLVRRWTTLILPAIFPSLLTGWITAVGGAWNASIVAEYMTWRGQPLSTTGLGAVISHATDVGEFNVLAAAVVIMAATVVTFNRLVWRPLSQRAQTRFALET